MRRLNAWPWTEKLGGNSFLEPAQGQNTNDDDDEFAKALIVQFQCSLSLSVSLKLNCCYHRCDVSLMLVLINGGLIN